MGNMCLIREEITFELTNYCEHHCMYCSSETVDEIKNATFIEIGEVEKRLKGKRFKRVILSGGEPLAHPEFYKIFCLCRFHTNDVVVYTNLLRHVAYNVNVHDGIYVEAALNISPEVSKVRVLRRIAQGREVQRPEVSVSRNFSENCKCENMVVKPNGEVAPSPCRKKG